MATDWAADVKKYAPDADDGVIAAIVRYCGIALQKVDSSLVSFSDPIELGRVRNNFLKKKCGLIDADDVLDAMIAKVGERMKGDPTRNRVTVYYLLIEQLGLHSLFGGASTVAKNEAAPVAAAAAAAAAVTLAAVGSMATAASSVGDAAPVMPVALATVVPMPSTGSAAAVAVAGGVGVTALGLAPFRLPIGRSGVWGLLADGGAGKSGRGFAVLALALLALALLWLLFIHKPTPSIASAVDASAPVTAAPAIADVAVPDGAGIITETRNEKPVLKVFFETGKAEVAPVFASEAGTFKTYLDAHPGTIIGVSGYNDPTGNAAANAELSKRRAKAVKAALIAAAIPDAAVELIKPATTTDAQVDKTQARRVEVYIK